MPSVIDIVPVAEAPPRLCTFESRPAPYVALADAVMSALGTSPIGHAALVRDAAFPPDDPWLRRIGSLGMALKRRFPAIQWHKYVRPDLHLMVVIPSRKPTTKDTAE